MSTNPPTADHPAGWRKSTRSGDQGACVEVALGGPDIGVRDSKDVTGPVLRFSPAAWAAFAAGPPEPPAQTPAAHA
ncbi:DUF397 domain-containing protein [Plantactinospora sp. GCM10030261]|uniref:DUF397 domain-containing protein n=1 Tax=Plantactinospora sp. GCM10030261 TaxID=3273420 RepID=UPI00360BA4B5